MGGMVMGIFTKDCYASEVGKNEFFLEWYNAIKKDMNVFEFFLSGYNESISKEALIETIRYIREAVGKSIDEDEEHDIVTLKSTLNYFLFSFMNGVSDKASYVLLSKKYDEILVVQEEMECFDDPNFDEDERYGIYDYIYFKLEDKNVYHYSISKKEYTNEYDARFYKYMYSKNVDETEKYYRSLLDSYSKKISHFKEKVKND